MEKRGEDLIDSEIERFNQIFDSLEEAVSKLEKAYDNKDYESFNKYKKFIFQTQIKISEMVK